MAVTLFSQRDPRWADIHLGTGQETIGQAGCLMTCVASLLVDVCGVETDPGRLNRWLACNGGYRDANLFIFSSVAPLGLKLTDVIPCLSDPAPMERMVATLVGGGGVIVKGDFAPGGAIQQHWVRLLDVGAEDCRIADPWLPPGSVEYWLMPRYSIPEWPNPERAIM